MLNRDFLLSLCCCCWGPVGIYSMALGMLVDLAGLGKAMDVGGVLMYAKNL